MGIEPIQLRAGRILRLEPVSFVWNRTGYADTGYIAEDMNAILPEIYREQGITRGYDLWKLPFFIIEGLKGQQKRIDGQREAIAKQQEQLARQDAEINTLTAIYCNSHPHEVLCTA